MYPFYIKKFSPHLDLWELHASKIMILNDYHSFTLSSQNKTVARWSGQKEHTKVLALWVSKLKFHLIYL